MDPLWFLLIGGALLVASLTSLTIDLRLHQCPGCLSVDFGSPDSIVHDHVAGTALKACKRCGCTVQIGEIDLQGNTTPYGLFQRRVIEPSMADPVYSRW